MRARSVQIPLTEKSGRRFRLLAGMVVMVVSMISLTLALNLQQVITWMPFVSVVCTIIFVIGFAVGLGRLHC